MNIFIISPNPIWGGAATANMAIARMLAGRHIVYYNDEYNALQIANVSYDAYPTHKSKNSNKLVNHLLELKIDFVIWGCAMNLPYYREATVLLHSKGIKQLGKQLVIFYLISFAFGGCAFALLYFIRPQDVLIQNGVYVGTYPIKIALLGGVVGFIITYIAFRVVKTKMKKKDMIYIVTIKINEKQVTLKAILDTGNLLKEPITGMPVIVVEKQELYSILPANLLNHIDELIGGDQNNFIEEIEEKEYLKKLRIIPFSSIGKQNGLMLGLKADEVIIQKEEEQEKNQNVIIGIFSEQLSKNHSYSALIGLELLERSESSEPITNFKG